MLQVSHLHKSFGGVRAVHDCSFSIPPSKITAIIGPNGAGKSTVFNMVCGSLSPDEGTIQLGNTSLVGLRSDQIAAKGVSRVFQQSRLFPNLSVEENLLLALRPSDQSLLTNWVGLEFDTLNQKKRIHEMLSHFHLQHHLHTLARELSFGQKRLVELIRAKIQPHQVMILDEPVGGVTPTLRESIAQLLLMASKQGDTIFFIEHDMNFTLRIADQVIVMDEGRVIARGTPKEIRKNKKVLEAYLGD